MKIFDYMKNNRGKIILTIILIIVAILATLMAFGCGFSMGGQSIACKLVAIPVSILAKPGLYVLEIGQDIISNARPLGQTSPLSKYEPLFLALGIVVEFIYIYLILSVVQYTYRKFSK